MSKRATVFMESTEIPAERTAAEVTQYLVAAGALTVSCKFDRGRVIGLSWTMKVGTEELPFTMPARIEPVYQILLARRTGYTDEQTQARLRAKAERVGWRQLLRWVQAQLAMIDSGMVKPSEVFMPYWEQANGQTLFEYFENKQLRLGPATPEKKAHDYLAGSIRSDVRAADGTIAPDRNSFV